MTAEQFTYWLQGFMEVADPIELTANQTHQIKDHLKLVFDKQTPDRTNPIFTPNTAQPLNPTWQEPHWQPNPYQITCDDNNNFPDLMTTPVCSTTTITTTPLDPDIQTALNGFAKETKTESKRNRFNDLKC
jgi:hypothetical protein